MQKKKKNKNIFFKKKASLNIGKGKKSLPLSPAVKPTHQNSGQKTQYKRWDAECEFSKIIDAIESMPEKDRTIYSTLELATAYKNKALLGDRLSRIIDGSGIDEKLFDKANRLAWSVADDVSPDDMAFVECLTGLLWAKDNRLENAWEHAVHWSQLGPKDVDINEILSIVDAERFKGRDRYNAAEQEAVRSHIEHYYGKIAHLIEGSEIKGPYVQIAVIPPSNKYNYYTLLTIGLGSHRMNVPEEYQGRQLERAELIMCLPPDWKWDARAEYQSDNWAWAFWLMNRTVFLANKNDLWLRHGRPLSFEINRKLFEHITQQSGVLLLDPQNVEEDACVCTLPDGDKVHFYQLIPIYYDEFNEIYKHGVSTLFLGFAKIGFVANLTRPHFLSGKNTGTH